MTLCTVVFALWVLAPPAPKPRMVALTFDDGPHQVHTAELLDILEENDAAATFFEVGEIVGEYPELLARAVSIGCEIGSHSYAHGNLAEMDEEAMLADLAAADEQFIRAIGQAPVLLRPPWGDYDQRLVEKSGKAIVTWSLDTRDWESRDARAVVDYVKGQGGLAGQVILMHSTHASSVEAAGELVPWLKEQGYQLVTVSQLIEDCYGETPAPGGVYTYLFFK